MQTLTITLNDERSFLKNSLARIKTALETRKPQGEILNFTSAAAFLAQLNDRKLRLLNCLLAQRAASETGIIAVRELARQLKRDVKRVHQDAQKLVELGLLKKTESGALFCPYDEIHIDMVLTAGKAAA